MSGFDLFWVNIILDFGVVGWIALALVPIAIAASLTVLIFILIMKDDWHD